MMNVYKELREIRKILEQLLDVLEGRPNKPKFTRKIPWVTHTRVIGERVTMRK